jgi:hypothetical protein
MFGTIKRNMLFFVLFMALLLSCAKDDKGINPLFRALVVEIVGGPDEGGSVANNARFTFTWRTISSSARGGGASVSYQVQLSGVDASLISTTETSKTYDGQSPGNYTFTVTATAGGETASASRSFSVGANAGPPQIVVNGARGSASAGGSGATPAMRLARRPSLTGPARTRTNLVVLPAIAGESLIPSRSMNLAWGHLLALKFLLQGVSTHLPWRPWIMTVLFPPPLSAMK